MGEPGPASVDEYIATFPAGTQEVLRQVRAAIVSAVPGAAETISYKIPAVTAGGSPVLYFAGWQRHVSVYPAGTGDAELDAALAPYRSGRGTLKFPLSRPVPYELIGRVARARAARA
jgi:uncharacterized protein YdhG (YjbR/CyaY superfamily)